MIVKKSPFMEETERRLAQLENDNEVLLHAVAELQERNIALFNMQVHFMSMMANELNKKQNAAHKYPIPK